MAQVQAVDIPADQVLAQSPTANATQVAAPKISLLVTVPADPQAFVMPSFVGQALGGASRSLQDAGFRLGNVNVVASASTAVEDAANPNASSASSTPETAAVPPTQTALPAQASPASIIISQTPEAGQKVFAGTTVNFDVR
jgi:beta-lactam-binding protein with PASTA domain